MSGARRDEAVVDSDRVWATSCAVAVPRLVGPLKAAA